MRRGKLAVISGPGGVGKGTVVAELRRRRPELAVSVSATTRAPRPQEREGVHYHFVCDARFDEMVAASEFLEWAEFGGFRYGTPWSSVRRDLEQERTVILEIEVQGALQIRERFPDALLIFLKPPDTDALVARLVGRGSDSAERIAQRLDIARWEMDQADVFDHVVVNTEVDAAVERIGRILDSNPDT